MTGVIKRLLERNNTNDPTQKDCSALFTEEEISFFTELGLGDILETLHPHGLE